ncbi:hypothetical protein EVAR_75637_1 [Eumeta japonica]|uniref:Uncharacterized protein n=1 Tax=Eumeta variegata TaxID=151549 RepID=A0A4C1U020_EUMVA|nr:hypothetical protein EVAR_75637_1 [Eumeta japonica]
MVQRVDINDICETVVRTGMPQNTRDRLFIAEIDLRSRQDERQDRDNSAAAAPGTPSNTNESSLRFRPARRRS